MYLQLPRFRVQGDDLTRYSTDSPVTRKLHPLGNSVSPGKAHGADIPSSCSQIRERFGSTYCKYAYALRGRGWDGGGRGCLCIPTEMAEEVTLRRKG